MLVDVEKKSVIAIRVSSRFLPPAIFVLYAPRKGGQRQEEEAVEGARENKNTIESQSATLAERKNRVVSAREKREKGNSTGGDGRRGGCARKPAVYLVGFVLFFRGMSLGRRRKKREATAVTRYRFLILVR